MGLCKVPSRDEIKKVEFGMKALKAPGPDGFPALFYKHHWDIVGDQLVFAVQSFFLNGWLLKDFNKTFISLIPKNKGAHNFNHFRPISLCNVSYKVISKIIVNRLRPLLDKTSRGPAHCAWQFFFMVVLLFEIFLNVLLLKLHYICISNIL